MTDKKRTGKPAAAEDKRDLNFVMNRDIALGLAQPRKLPREEPKQQ